MPTNRKVIISCAITGAIHTPSMSPYLPVTPEDIATAAIEAAEAGAAVVHLHARNPADGNPASDPKLYREILSRIKAESDVVANITTGGALHTPVEVRLQPALAMQPELCSLNMGSMNFGLFSQLAKYDKWEYDWEQEYLEKTHDFVLKNTFKDIEYFITHLGEGCGTRFEYECYDVGHLYTLAHFLDRKRVQPPLFVQTIFGVLGGIGPEVDNLLFMRRTADRLFGNAYEWSVLGAGRHQLGLTITGANLGSHVRVGLEDSLYIAKGKLAKSNAEQVRKIRMMIENLSLDIASPDEARNLLKLKGADKVAF